MRFNPYAVIALALCLGLQAAEPDKLDIMISREVQAVRIGRGDGGEIVYEVLATARTKSALTLELRSGDADDNQSTVAVLITVKTRSRKEVNFLRRCPKRLKQMKRLYSRKHRNRVCGKRGVEGSADAAGMP